MLPEVDRIMADYVQPGEPGAAVAVVKSGEVVHRQGYGQANVEWGIPIAPDTVFRLASVTKQFTAVSMMILHEQGKLSIEDSITRYIPDYPTSGHTITIRHLMSHTAGLKNYTSLESIQKEYWTKDLSPQELQNIYKAVPIEFKPGDRFTYSNSGYHLMGMIIENVSGMTYADFVRQHIFEPLDMKNSYYMSVEPIIRGRASGYLRTPDGFRNAGYLAMTIPYSAGALGSTVDDLVKWVSGLHANRLISAESLARMRQVTPLNNGSTSTYGLGWVIDAYAEHPVIHHGGDIDGFSTLVVEFPHDDLAMVVLSNIAGFPCERVVRQIYRQLVGLPEVTRERITLDEAALAKCAGTYLVDEMQAPIQIAVHEDGLVVPGVIQGKLVPMSASEFFLDSDPEAAVIFLDEQDGRFTRGRMNVPLMGLSLIRLPDPPSAE